MSTDTVIDLDRLAMLVDEFGARHRARTSLDRQSDSYMAGVLHGLCIAQAALTGRDSHELLHAQMSGEPPRVRRVGEIRLVTIGQGITGNAHAVERWTGETWERIP